MPVSPDYSPSAEERLLHLVRRGFSTRAATAQLRSEGYRIGNDRARALVNLARQQDLTARQRRVLGIPQEVRFERGRRGFTTTIKATFQVIAPLISHWTRSGATERRNVESRQTITIPISGIKGRQSLVTAMRSHISTISKTLARAEAERTQGYQLQYQTNDLGQPTRIRLIRTKVSGSGPYDPEYGTRTRQVRR